MWALDVQPEPACRRKLSLQLLQPRAHQLTALRPAGFAAQSILAALGSVQFVSNVVFAWFVLQEAVRPLTSTFHILQITTATHAISTLQLQDFLMYDTWSLMQATRRVCAATACIVLGCIILVTFGNHQSTTLTVQDMLQYYERQAPRSCSKSEGRPVMRYPHDEGGCTGAHQQASFWILRCC